MNEPSSAGPPVGPRATLRRRQVLDAASNAFRQHGFHATSMAQIAGQAGMSVGHIYRYFPGKEDIITAIVREDIADHLAMMAELHASGAEVFPALVERADQGVTRMADPLRAAMMLEVRAESARNPKIAAMLQAVDRELRDHTRRLLNTAKPASWSDADVEGRIDALALLFEGIPLRIMAHPDLDLPALKTMIRLIISALLDYPNPGSDDAMTAPSAEA